MPFGDHAVEEFYTASRHYSQNWSLFVCSMFAGDNVRRVEEGGCYTRSGGRCRPCRPGGSRGQWCACNKKRAPAGALTRRSPIRVDRTCRTESIVPVRCKGDVDMKAVGWLAEGRKSVAVILLWDGPHSDARKARHMHVGSASSRH